MTVAMTKTKKEPMTAEEFRVLLARKNMSNDQAAEILNVHRNTISNWIHERYPISLAYTYMIEELISPK